MQVSLSAASSLQDELGSAEEVKPGSAAVAEEVGEKTVVSVDGAHAVAESAAEKEGDAASDMNDTPQEAGSNEYGSVMELLAQMHKLQESLPLSVASGQTPGLEDIESCANIASRPTNEVAAAGSTPETASKEDKILASTVAPCQPTVTPPATRGSGTLKRSLSFNTQEQVDTLVVEAGSLLTRLTSSDARGVAGLLQDLSSSNMLAALLATELELQEAAGPAAEAVSEATVPKTSAVSLPVEAGVCEPQTLLRSSSLLKRSVSFNTQEQLQLLVEETGALMARLGSTDARDVASLLHDMRDKNTLAAILATELDSSAADVVPKDVVKTKEVDSNDVTEPYTVQEALELEATLTKGVAEVHAAPTQNDELNDAKKKAEELKRYAEFLAENKRKRLSRSPATKSNGPLENILKSPGRCAPNGVEASPTQDEQQSPSTPTTPVEYQSFLRRHKEKRKMFKAMLNSPSFRAQECIEESPAESCVEPESVQPMPRTLSGSALAVLDETGSATSSILHHGNNAGSDTTLSSGNSSPVQNNRCTLKSNMSFNSQEQLQLLVEETGALMARLESTDARDVASLLHDMRNRNTLAEILAHELDSASAEIAPEPVHEAVSEPETATAGNQPTFTPPATRGSGTLKRSLSFNTQEQVDTLVVEAGSLLTRLTSSDARGVAGLLQDLSSSNMLAALLATELELQEAAAATEEGEAAAEAVLKTPEAYVSLKQDDVCGAAKKKEEELTLYAEFLAENRRERCPIAQHEAAPKTEAGPAIEPAASTVPEIPAAENSLAVLKSTMSFSSQEQLQLLVEETGALMARLGSSGAADVASVLHDMSDRNTLAAILAAELDAPDDQAATHDVSSNIADGAKSLRRSSSLKRSFSLNSQEQIDTLVSEASSLMTRMSSQDSRDLYDVLLELSVSNGIAAILSSEITSRTASGQEVKAAASVQTAEATLAKQVEVATKLPSVLQRSISLNTQADLHLLVEETGALMGRLGSTDAADVISTLQAMRSRSSLAAILSSAFDQGEVSSSRQELTPATPATFAAPAEDSGKTLPTLKRQLSISTQDQLNILINEAGTLLDRLSSTNAAAMSNVLLELSEENMLASLLVQEAGVTEVAKEKQVAQLSASPPNRPPLLPTNSLTRMFLALKHEGAVVERALPASGPSFAVDGDEGLTEEAFTETLAAALESDCLDADAAPSPVKSTLTRTMDEFRSQAAATRQAIKITIDDANVELVPVEDGRGEYSILNTPKGDQVPGPRLTWRTGSNQVEQVQTVPEGVVAKEPGAVGSCKETASETVESCEKTVSEGTADDVDLFPIYEYESEDDASDDDDGENISVRKRGILRQGLKVLHLTTLNIQSEFLFFWLSALPGKAVVEEETAQATTPAVEVEGQEVSPCALESTAHQPPAPTEETAAHQPPAPTAPNQGAAPVQAAVEEGVPAVETAAAAQALAAAAQAPGAETHAASEEATPVEDHPKEPAPAAKVSAAEAAATEGPAVVLVEDTKTVTEPSLVGDTPSGKALADDVPSVAGIAEVLHIHAYTRTYMHTCIHAYIHSYIHTIMHPYNHTSTCMHSCIHTCMHTFIHTHT